MSLMIAPATGPSLLGSTDSAGGTESSDSGEQFAEVLAGRTGTASAAQDRVTGSGRRAGHGNGEPDPASDLPADQGAAMLALAGAVVAVNPLRPASVTDPGAAATAGIASVTGQAGATPGGTDPSTATAHLAAAGQFAATQPGSPAASSTVPSATVPVAATTAAGPTPAVPSTSMNTGKSSTDVSTGSASAGTASQALNDQAANTAQSTGGAASPLPVASSSTAPPLAAIQTTTQPAGTPAQQAPAKPGSPDALGAMTAAANAHTSGKADTRASAGDKDGSRDQRSSSGQGFIVTETGQSPTPVVPATATMPSPTVAGLTVANSIAPNPQLTSTPQAATPAGQTAHYPSVPQPLAHQLAGPVLDVRASGDGSRQLSISLHPAELGPVNLHVRIEGDVMTIQLASTSESAHDAIRAALPQLRHELQSAGLAGVDVSLDFNAGNSANSGGTADPRNGRAAQPNRFPPAGALPNVPAIVNRPSAQSNSGLDRWL